MKALCFASCLALVLAVPSRSAMYAVDDAGNYSSWNSGDNGGQGFSAWSLSSNNDNAGRYLGSSTYVSGGGSGPNINSANGNSFALYGHNDGSVSASRTFANGQTLAAGQTLSFVMVVNYRNGNKGFDLRSSNGTTLWNFNVGGDQYNVNYNGSSSLFNNAYDHNTVLTWHFTENANGTLSWEVDRSGGLSGIAYGTADISVGTLAGINFYVNATDGADAANNLFFNSLSVLPEPAHWGLLSAVGLLGICGCRAWRQRCC